MVNWSRIVDAIKNNRFITKIVLAHKRYVELINVFKSRAVIFYVIATIGLLIRAIFFYNIYPEDWQSRIVWSILYTYSSVSIGLLAYYYLITLGYWDNVIKAFFGSFVNIERIRKNRERRKAYKPLFQQKLHEAGLKDASIFWVVMLSLWVHPLSVYVFRGLSFYLFILWYIWFCWFQFFRAWRAYKFAIDNPAPLEYQYIRPKPLQEWLDEPVVYTHGGKGTVSETAARLGKLLIESSKKTVRQISADPGRAFILFSGGTSLFFTTFGGVDYMFAEPAGRTTLISRTAEYLAWSGYSADVETRQRAGWLRFRGIELVDCIIPGTRRLDPELVEALYDSKHKPDRVSALETTNSSLMSEQIELAKQLLESYQLQLEQKDTIIEQKDTIIEQKDTIIELMKDSTSKDDKIKELERKLLELDNKQ